MAIDGTFKPDPKRKGSYYRRIEDVDRALDKMDAQNFPPVAAFISNMFTCEKLALAIVGISRSEPAPDAYKRKLNLTEIKQATKILGLTVTDVDLDYIFAAYNEQAALATHSPTHVRSARDLRNSLAHDIGPTKVVHIEAELTFLSPKMKNFLACKQEVLNFLRDNYAHVQ
tara:strand:+ start:433 stop:945 length:513 start_codon:yes stop_codon:yes gene_type:complete